MVFTEEQSFMVSKCTHHTYKNLYGARFCKTQFKKNEKHQFISNKECILKSHTMSSDTSVQTNFHRKAILYNTKEYTLEKNITTVTSAQNNFQQRAIIQDIKDYTLEKSLSFQCYIRPKQLSHKCNLSQHQRMHTGEKPF